MDWLEEAIKRQATPKHLRQGSTEEFCAQFGINVKEFYYQLSKSDNKKMIIEIALNEAKNRVPEVLEKLGELAESGDMRAIDSYMEYILQLSKQLDIKSDGKPIFLPSEIAKKNGLTNDTNSSSISNS